MVKLDEKDLYQLLIAEFRYSVGRDNHLAPSGCAQHIKDYLPEMKNEWQTHTAEQLTNEIIQGRIWTNNKPLEQDSEWEKLLVFLTNYLIRLPYEAERYMHYLYKKPGYDANIDYYSDEIAEKIKNNCEKK